jgi:hypothetical protein
VNREARLIFKDALFVEAGKTISHVKLSPKACIGKELLKGNHLKTEQQPLWRLLSGNESTI